MAADSGPIALSPMPAKADDLLDRCKAGQPEAFRELYRRHHRQVASQLAFLVPRSDLEDTLQDVFIEVFRSLKKFEGRSAFTTWLYRLTVHVAMKARRKQVRSRLDVVEELPETADQSAGPDDTTLAAERRARVEQLLEKLSPKKRTVLVLHDLRGMEASRIAEVLDTNILTVRTRLFYARRELEQLAQGDPALKEFFTPEGPEGE
ncbi:MAG: sigma-70 family RNA polymerase sigma factor [Myxococcaceae bacterium]